MALAWIRRTIRLWEAELKQNIMYLFYAGKLWSCSEGSFFFLFLQVHLETTGEAARINKEEKTEANLACACCEQRDGFVFSRICSLVLQKALAPTAFF